MVQENLTSPKSPKFLFQNHLHTSPQKHLSFTDVRAKIKTIIPFNLKIENATREEI